jgi:hypothetical protein
MAVKQSEPVPLYIHTIYRIVREMRLIQQEEVGVFDYKDFKNRILDSGLTPAQLSPLSQRLETLESFMPGFGSTFSGKERLANGLSKLADTWSSNVCNVIDLLAFLTPTARATYHR